MTNEELVNVIQQGDDSKTEELWNQCAPFINQQAGKYFRRYKDGCQCEQDDLKQSGYFALLDAVRSFDSSKGNAFLTYLGFHLLRHFRQTAGFNKPADVRFRKCISLDEPLYEDNDDIFLIDTIADAGDSFAAVDNAIAQKELHDGLEMVLDAIDQRQADILRGIYYQGLTANEIAAAHSISISRLNQIKAAGLKAMGVKIAKTSAGKKLEGLIDEYVSGYSRSAEQVVLKREVVRKRLLNSTPVYIDLTAEEYAALGDYRMRVQELHNIYREAKACHKGKNSADLLAGESAGIETHDPQ